MCWNKSVFVIRNIDNALSGRYITKNTYAVNKHVYLHCYFAVCNIYYLTKGDDNFDKY